MAGLLAWAADVVGANESGSDVSDDPSSIPLILTPQQQQYLNELNQKSTSLTRSIQDLRIRLPPSDIAQRLPHLHAHSLASNAALTLQLNSHSFTREQAQQREAKLLEENAAYEKEITKCEAKIQEKLQEAEQFQQKLKELDSIEENLKTELQRVQAASSASQSEKSVVQHEKEVDTAAEEDASRTALLEELENQKKEMQLTEEKIQMLEKKWADVQEKALKQPSPAQREKALDKQLHSLMEQLAAKQAQAEALINEIHIKEKELERLNALWRRVENTKEATAARNRFAKSGPTYGYETDTDLDSQSNLPYHSGGRSEYRQRLRILRSSFVLYVFLLHIIVFIRISFI
ncbi:centrosomal protein of 164 kDa-like [Chenopodium quinoa]|uniref:centrosomal protein of 164 kDa-like n=1 Tax=Chenopodium quinoa TaxID=63459 RepID=UPI000B77A59E|nr:centrosomal protein of 164 kDa-like [Chenopodium quinoa]